MTIPSQLPRLAVWKHTADQPVPQEILQDFIAIANRAFSGRDHKFNFGDKDRYPSIEPLLQDLSHEGGAWVYILYDDQDTAIACAKITLSGKGMDGGPGVHEHSVAGAQSQEDSGITTFWLGALSSLTKGAGGLIMSEIKRFLANECEGAFKVKAYTVAEWGISKDWNVPTGSTLVKWFEGQGFRVTHYSWKPPGTWQCFYGACLASIEYIHM